MFDIVRHFGVNFYSEKREKQSEEERRHVPRRTGLKSLELPNLDENKKNWIRC